MQVLCVGRGGQGVCAAWPSLGVLVGAGCTGYVGAGLAPQFVLASLMLLDPLGAMWGGLPRRHLLACCKAAQTSGAREGWGQAAMLSSLCLCEILCSSSAHRGGRQSGGEWVSPFNSITKQMQDPASWASSILIGISTRTPAPAEHFYRTENKFSNKPEWLNQGRVGRDLYIEYTGIPNQRKQPKNVSPVLWYLNARSTFWGGSADGVWICSEKFGFRALIRLMW